MTRVDNPTFAAIAANLDLERVGWIIVHDRLRARKRASRHSVAACECEMKFFMPLPSIM